MTPLKIININRNSYPNDNSKKKFGVSYIQDWNIIFSEVSQLFLMYPDVPVLRCICYMLYNYLLGRYPAKFACRWDTSVHSSTESHVHTVTIPPQLLSLLFRLCEVWLRAPVRLIIIVIKHLKQKIKMSVHQCISVSMYQCINVTNGDDFQWINQWLCF